MSEIEWLEVRLNKKGYEVIDCPVCGTEVELDDICEQCKWQNTGEYNIDGGPNEMTLEEARVAYKEGRPIY